MTIDEYQQKAMSTCMDRSHNYTYMAEGMVGEMGELMSKVAKGVRKGKMKVSSNTLVLLASKQERPEILEGLKSELGDILWFVAGMADVMGWSLEEVAQANIDKLASRKERGVIQGDGDNR